MLVSVIGAVCGVGLTLAAKFMAVPVDETAVKIRECLPGANCGGCGFAGCDDYAAALAADPTIA
ncbi:MAG: ferredoxin, partial [Firmicutes bacterium]|nr:ferredoxin [Bacillota bacterium]